MVEIAVVVWGDRLDDWIAQVTPTTKERPCPVPKHISFILTTAWALVRERVKLKTPA